MSHSASIPQNNKPNYAASASTSKPEIRDNLDSRNNEEQDDKGKM